MKDNDRLHEELLDEMLRSYARVEPDAGLEDRLTASLLESRILARRWRMRMRIAAGLAALVLIPLFYIQTTGVKQGQQDPVPVPEQATSLDSAGSPPAIQGDLPAENLPPSKAERVSISDAGSGAEIEAFPFFNAIDAESTRGTMTLSQALLREAIVLEESPEPSMEKPLLDPTVEEIELIQTLSVAPITISEFTVASLGYVEDSPPVKSELNEGS